MKKKIKILIFILLFIGAVISLVAFTKRNKPVSPNDQKNTVEILNEVTDVGTTQAVETPEIK